MITQRLQQLLLQQLPQLPLQQVYQLQLPLKESTASVSSVVEATLPQLAINEPHANVNIKAKIVFLIIV